MWTHEQKYLYFRWLKYLTDTRWEFHRLPPVGLRRLIGEALDICHASRGDGRESPTSSCGLAAGVRPDQADEPPLCDIQLVGTDGARTVGVFHGHGIKSNQPHMALLADVAVCAPLNMHRPWWQKGGTLYDRMRRTLQVQPNKKATLFVLKVSGLHCLVGATGFERTTSLGALSLCCSDTVI